jgi:uncharacterized protein YcbK (DUF882 family)
VFVPVEAGGGAQRNGDTDIMFKRRAVLTMGLGAMASAGFAAAPTFGWADIAPQVGAPSSQFRSVSMNNLHTGESMEAVYWDGGDYLPDVLDAVNLHLRDYRTGDVHPIDPRLLDLLDSVSQLTDAKAPFEVISGFRSAATNALLHERSAEVAKKSFHVQGMAIDVRLADVELRHLHAAARSLGRGGVGYYPDSNFVHLDVGPVRSWSGT